jgi:uncharacterized protein DUF3576
MFSTLTLRPTLRPDQARVLKLVAIAGMAAFLVACAGGNKAGSSRTAGLPSYSLDGKSGVATSVNRYLWAASLETLDFMPIFSADPIAGIIITDWYGVPRSTGDQPTERFKTTVYILDTTLRADALRVAVFRQELTANGWMDAKTNPSTAREVENAILTRARELRLNSIN